jgi:mannosyltransferase OCH1-like enzyme
MPIPKIIHQTHSGRNALPEEITANIAKIRELNPGWEYRLYDDGEIFRFIKSRYGERLHRAARKINPKYGVVLADLFRYLVVYLEGGVYLDIKSSMTAALDDFLKPDDCYLLSQWRNKFGEEFQGFGMHPELYQHPGGEFQQWHVIAAPRHPFLEAVIKRVLFNIENYDQESSGVGGYGVLRLSGPVCYTLAILPLLRDCRFQVVDIQKAGLLYTIYRGLQLAKHPKHSPEHYSNQLEPIIL